MKGVEEAMERSRNRCGGETDMEKRAKKRDDEEEGVKRGKCANVMKGWRDRTKKGPKR